MSKQEIEGAIKKLKAAKEYYNTMAYAAKMIGRNGEVKQYKKEVKRINNQIAYLEFCLER